MRARTKARILRALDTAEHGSDRLLDAVQAAMLSEDVELEQRMEERCEADARQTAEQEIQDAADLERHWPAHWKIQPNEHSHVHYPSMRVA